MQFGRRGKWVEGAVDGGGAIYSLPNILAPPDPESVKYINKLPHILHIWSL